MYNRTRCPFLVSVSAPSRLAGPEAGSSSGRVLHAQHTRWPKAKKERETKIGVTLSRTRNILRGQAVRGMGSGVELTRCTIA